jgi:Mycothiol maleylpyruvate isomerase N-terminal domain
MCSDEDRGWAEFIGTVESLSPAQLEMPGYYPEGWSVKDLIAHIGSWQAEAGRILEQIRFCTFRHDPIDLDAMNREFFEANRDLPLAVVKAECWSARTRMLTAMNLLPEVTQDAEEWFVESGAEHYGEHLPRLREWARELGGGG